MAGGRGGLWLVPPALSLGLDLSPSSTPNSGSQGRTRLLPAWLGAFLLCNLLSTKKKKKSVLNRAELRMGCSPDEVSPSLESPAGPVEGWSTPSASYSKHS